MNVSTLKWPKPHKESDTGIFSSRVYVYTNKEKHKAALAYLGESSITPAVGVAQAFQNKVDGSHIIVVGWFDGVVSTLIHEVSHATFYVLDSAGVLLTADNHETFCYLQEYLFNKLWTDPATKTKTAKTSQLDSSKSGHDQMLSSNPSTPSPL
jgi:hypothetical protein